MSTRKNLCPCCEQREIVYKEAELCSACYQGILYWNKKTPTETVRRQRQLIALENRMDYVTSITVLNPSRKRN